jgi:hypothetical protein
MTEDFTMIAGTSRVLRFSVVDDAGAPIDITGAEIVWVATIGTDTEPVITKSTDDVLEINVTSYTNGTFDVYLVPTDTSAEAEDATTLYYHEARTIILGIEEVVHQGTFTVTYSTSYGHMP